MKALRRVGALTAIAAVCLFIAYILRIHAAGRPEAAPPAVSTDARRAAGVESTGGEVRKSAAGAAESSGDSADVIGADKGTADAIQSALTGPGSDAGKALTVLRDNCRNWLGLKSMSARYKVEHTAQIPGQEPFKYEDTGTIELVVTPLDTLQHYRNYKVSVRVTNERLGVTFVTDNIYDQSKEALVWTLDNPETASRVRQDQLPNVFRSMYIDPLLEPLHMARDIYNDAGRMGGVGAFEKQLLQHSEFFQRASTPEETEKIFNGESQYLVGFSAGPLQYWLARDKGEMRRLAWDRSENGASGSFQYYDYDTGGEGQVKFPARFVREIHMLEGPQAGGGESSVFELTDMKINQPIPADRFRLNNR